MDQTTAYAYQKRIKELEAQVEQLAEERRIYRCIGEEIHDMIIDHMINNKTTSMAWIISKFKGAWK